MNLAGIFKIFRQTAVSNFEVKADNYLPEFWEDDFCQIEIVPCGNKEYLLKTLGQISDLANKSRTGIGFTETFGRGEMPVPTFSREIRADYLEKLLTEFEFEKAKSICYNSREIIDCETGSTKAYGFPSFTVFFDTDGEFVKNIWLSIDRVVSGTQYDLLKSALYSLGEECEMVLVDWNGLELFDLRDKTQIGQYLGGHLSDIR
jgi:hypothetical protein